MTLPFFHYLDFSIQPFYHAARFEKDNCYYVIRLEHDLLGDWIITAINGRVKSKLGQIRKLALPSFIDGLAQFCELATSRFQHDYHLKTLDSDNYLLLHLLPFLIITDSYGQPVQPSQPVKKRRLATNSNKSTHHSNNHPRHNIQQLGFCFEEINCYNIIKKLIDIFLR